MIFTVPGVSILPFLNSAFSFLRMYVPGIAMRLPSYAAYWFIKENLGRFSPGDRGHPNNTWVFSAIYTPGRFVIQITTSPF